MSNLQDALAEPATPVEALEILQSLIEPVSVKTGENDSEIELVGEIANMLRLSARSETSGKEPHRSSVKWLRGGI